MGTRMNVCPGKRVYRYQNIFRGANTSLLGMHERLAPADNRSKVDLTLSDVCDTFWEAHSEGANASHKTSFLIRPGPKAS